MARSYPGSGSWKDREKPQQQLLQRGLSSQGPAVSSQFPWTSKGLGGPATLSAQGILALKTIPEPKRPCSGLPCTWEPAFMQG